jgi:hypothetical protein
MQLEVSSDASYLSDTKARSRVGGVAYLQPDNTKTDTDIHLPNGPIDIVCSILQPVVTAAMEAEYGALYVNARKAAELVNTLEDLGHTQRPVKIYCDNKPAVSIANNTAKQKRSKAIDMRFNWIKDRTAQGQFEIIWDKGCNNVADFVTKAHPTKHFQTVRTQFITDKIDNTLDLPHKQKQFDRRLKYLKKTKDG